MTSDRSLLRAIRGPVLLITLGLLFTADYFLNYPFHRTWPVLLIIFGILKLAERLGASPAEPSGGGPA
jgi:hypothetical protein